MLNKLKPDTIKKINEQKLPFKQMENIENYSRACKGLGRTHTHTKEDNLIWHL